MIKLIASLNASHSSHSGGGGLIVSGSVVVTADSDNKGNSG